ncbi:MAG: flavin reductase family protein [Nocardioides sp.]|uniref:flavin reductase family protein n=1 Tax=Nocardioides sp. TaxID=35761 RepID=UPI0039E405C7
MSASIDPTLYRTVMGHHPTGVVVVTALVEDAPVGMVVGTFSAVSLDPPLVSFLPQRSSRTYARLRDAETFCVNVVAADQLELCRTLAGRAPDRFDRIAWTTSPYGAPALDGVVARVHCHLAHRIEAGDHDIVMCAVDGMEVVRSVAPLIFFSGQYGRFSPATRSNAEDWLEFADFV